MNRYFIGAIGPARIALTRIALFFFCLRKGRKVFHHVDREDVTETHVLGWLDASEQLYIVASIDTNKRHAGRRA